MWSLSVHTVFWDLSDFRWNLYFVLHFGLSLFCVLTVVCRWSMLQLWCISVVFAVQKITLSEIKFFIHVIIVMAYVFNAFHVVTVVYNGGSCIYFKNVQHCKWFWVCYCPYDINLVELWNLLYVFLTLKCVFILIRCVTQEVFQISFSQVFFERQNLRKVYTVGGKGLWYQILCL
jgi:hypothetical protein